MNREINDKICPSTFRAFFIASLFIQPPPFCPISEIMGVAEGVSFLTFPIPFVLPD